MNGLATSRITSAAPMNLVTILTLPVAMLLGSAISLIFAVAPREVTMGDAQRIMYVHVAVAWCGLASVLASGVAGIAYLKGRSLASDGWAQAFTEIGWLCCVLTLITGSIWAHEAWNTWWTWEPRLTSMLILAAICSGNLLLRGSFEDPHQRARIGAIVALLAILDVPLIVLATRIFRGIHPVHPSMSTTMRAVLVASVVGFAALFLLITEWRRRQIMLGNSITDMENREYNC